MACTQPQKGKEDESERLRVERDQIKFIDFPFERRQVVGFRERKKEAGRPMKLHVFRMNGNFWDTIRRFSSNTWKGCG